MLLPQDVLDRLDHYTVDNFVTVQCAGGGVGLASQFKLCFKPWWKRSEKIEISCLRTEQGDVSGYSLSADAVELAAQLHQWAQETLGAQEALEQSQNLLRELASRR